MREDDIILMNILLNLLFRSHENGKNRNPKQFIPIMFKTNHQYFVYILSSKKNGVLYIGVTNDLQRRVFEHKNRVTKGFTSRYNIDKLVYFEEYTNINEAIKREKQLKKWNRQWKIDLIEKDNLKWIDLAADWKA